MGSMLSQPNLPTPLLVSESRAKTAKADLRKAEKDTLWVELGKCMVFVCYDAGISLKEFAAKLGKDERQIARQMEGQERPQIETVFAVPEYRARLVEALARITPECVVSTEIKVRRTA
jgi:transcriptional regulator with XRE-family HTH domain